MDLAAHKMSGQPFHQRLQKILSRADLGSRRACEALIVAGRVRVNGQVAQLGQRADPKRDRITVDGRPIDAPASPFYVAVYKPRHVLSTNAAQAGDERPTLRGMLPFRGHLYAIGRLDAASEGLIIFTNDGALTQKITHPRYGHTKTYQITVYGRPSEATSKEWANGVWLLEERRQGGRLRRVKTAPCVVQFMGKDRTSTARSQQSQLRVVLREGRKRQLRLVAAQLGHPIRRLRRTHIGQLSLGSLRPGEYRVLGQPDIEAMFRPDPAFPK